VRRRAQPRKDKRKGGLKPAPAPPEMIFNSRNFEPFGAKLAD